MAKKRNLGSIFAFLELDVSDFEKKLENAPKKLRNAGRAMERAGKQLSLGVSAPIAVLGGTALKAAIDFESAFAGVRKTVDASPEAFKRLEKGILDMSRRLPATAVEIAAVAEAAGQLGIKTENILQFSETMIALGETTNLSSDQAASALARFANITGLSQDQFENLGSTIVALGNNFATTESEIVEMSLRLAGAGKQIGLSQAEILSFAAALTSVGIQAEAGGTAFSKVMKDIQVATELGGEKLAAFAEVAGMSTDTFSQLFKNDSAKALNKFVEGFLRISQEGGSALQALDKVGLASVRTSDALLRSANAGELMRKALALGTKAFKDNTALADEVALRYSTLASQLDTLRNNFTLLAIQIGNELTPYLKQLIPLSREWAESMAEADPRTRQVAVSLGLVAAAIGPTLVLGGKFLAFLGFANPAVLTLAAGLGAAAAFWIKYGEDFERGLSIVSENWPRVVQEFETGLQVIKTNWDTSVADFGRGVDVIKNFFTELPGAVISKVQSLVEGVRLWMVDKFDALVVQPVKQKIEFITGLFDWMDDEVVRNSYVPDMITGIIAEFKRLDEGMVGKTKTTTAEVVRLFGALEEGAQKKLKGAIEAMEDLSRAFEQVGAELDRTKLEFERGGLERAFQGAIDGLNTADLMPLRDRLIENTEAGIRLGMAQAFEAADAAELAGQKELADQLRAQAEELVDYKTRLEIDAINGRIKDAQRRQIQENFNFWSSAFENAITGQTFNLQDMFKRVAVGFAAELASSLTLSLGLNFGSLTNLQGLGQSLAQGLLGTGGGFGLGAIFSGGAAAGGVSGIGPVASGSAYAASLGGGGLLASLGPLAAAPLAALTVQNSISGIGSIAEGGRLSLMEQAALALPTFGASFLYNPISSAFSGGKDKAQQQRDEIRKMLQERGILDDDYMLSLFGGGKFDLGRESLGGGRQIYNLNDSGEFAGIGNLLSLVAGGGEKLPDLAAMFSNALAEAGSFNAALITGQGLLDKFGFSAEQAGDLVLQSFLDGKISIEEFNAGMATAAQLGKTSLGSITEAADLLAQTIDGPPRDALKAMEIAFATFAEQGIGSTQELMNFFSDRFGPESAAVIDRLAQHGIDLFTDFSTLSQDQVVYLINELQLLIPLLADIGGEAVETGSRTERSFGGMASALDEVIRKAREAKAAVAEIGSAPSGPGIPVNQASWYQNVSNSRNDRAIVPTSGSSANAKAFTINIDARGADAGAEARLVRAIERVRGDILRDVSRLR